MKAMILCAGEGTRLRPLTSNIPKCMIEIGSRPLLYWNIELCKKFGINEIGINLHYLPDTIKDYLGDGAQFKVEIEYSFEEKLLGSAGAVKKLQWFFDEPFFVIYGDLLTDLNLKKIMDFHRSRGGVGTISLYQVDNPTECGLVMTDKDELITEFVEKPEPENVFTDWANAGVYIIEPEVLKEIPENQEYDFGHDLFPKLLKDNQKLYGYRIKDTLIDIGTFKNYEKAKEIVKKGEFVI